jgi:photosystem II stability/assembly factor-like uncharacterized protein
MSAFRRRRWPRTVSLLLALSLALAAAAAAAGWRSEGPDLGAVHDLAVDPAHPDTVYAATHNGGVWRSDDFGKTWSLPGTDMTGWTVLWVEADPGTPGTVWCGIDAPGDPALFRSRDRGATWERVTDQVAKGQLTDMHPTGVRIAFAPSSPKEIWVPSTNLHYRSRDGGKTWSDFRVPDQDAYAIAVDPTDPRVVYAGGRGSSHHLSRSDDGGKTWKPIGAGLPEQSIKVVLVDPQRSAHLVIASGFSDLFASTDRGETFTPLPTPAGGTSELTRLVFAPDDSRVLWAATAKGLFVSRDAGSSWSRSEEGTGRYVVESVAYDPRDPRRMLAASGGGGVFASADGGASWQPSSRGLAAAWVDELWAAPGTAAIFAQTSVGLYRLDAQGAWSELVSPFADEDEAAKLDGMTFDPRAPGAVWAFDGGHAWRAADGRWFQELKQKEPSLKQMMKGDLASAQFRSLALDAGDSKILYAGSWSNDGPGQAVFKSTDAGKSFRASGTGLPAGEITTLVAVAPGVVLAVAEKKQLFRSRDGGTSWSAAGSGLPAVELRQIGCDPADPQRLFVATEQGLFRSTDEGASFAAVAGALAGEDVEAVVVAPGGRVFAASFHGVFASGDGGASFAALPAGLPLEDVRALAVGGQPARLWAGTAGTGVWSIELP